MRTNQDVFKPVPNSRSAVKSKPVISVIMPCYNESRRIAEGIKSVFTQTFSDLELIVIDDGSTDDSLDVLENLKRKYVDLKVISQLNKGAGPARNRGLREARGEYIAFLDADDSWHDDCLNLLHHKLNASPDAALVYCGWQNRGLPEDRCKSFVPPDYEQSDKQEVLLRGCRWPIHAALTRKAAIESVGGFNERWTSCMDYDLWLHIASFNKIVTVPTVLAYYQHHDGDQITKNRLRIARNHSSIQRHFLEEHPEIRKSLGRSKVRDIIEGELLSRGYQSYWQRDLETAHALFREVLSNLYVSKNDLKYLLPALIPLPIYKSLILRRDSEH